MPPLSDPGDSSQLVTGKNPNYTSDKMRWDCTSPNPALHWTNVTVRYCYSDYQQIIQAIAANPNITVTDPQTVGKLYGRPFSPLTATALARPALTGVALWEIHNPPAGGHVLGLIGLPYRLASPGAAIGLGLLVLAWAERNRARLALALAYLVAVLVPLTFGPDHYNPPWYSYPAVLQGTVLLLGGIGFALAQRPPRSPAP